MKDLMEENNEKREGSNKVMWMILASLLCQNACCKHIPKNNVAHLKNNNVSKKGQSYII